MIFAGMNTIVPGISPNQPHYKITLTLISGISGSVYLFNAVLAWPPDTRRYHLSPGTPQGDPPTLTRRYLDLAILGSSGGLPGLSDVREMR